MMTFGLTNTPPRLQSNIHWVLNLFFDITLMVCLKNVLRFSYNLFQIEKYVCKVFKALFQADSPTKLRKCSLGIKCIICFSFIIIDQCVKMKKYRITSILNWL